MANNVTPALPTSTEVPFSKDVSISDHQVVKGSLEAAFIKSSPSNIRTATFSLSNLQFLRTPPYGSIPHPIKLSTRNPPEDTQLVPEQQNGSSFSEKELQKDCNSLIRHMIGQRSTLIPKRTRTIRKLEALLNEDPPKFLELCRKAMTEISHQTNVEAPLPVKSANEEGPIISEDTQPKRADTFYDKLVPVLGKAGSEISLMEDSPEINKKIISVFGRRLFDAVLDPEEILERCASSRTTKSAAKKATGNEYDADKICMIARCLAWLISKPGDLSIAQFKKFEAGLLKKTETGLDTNSFRYFKETILIKYGCERRRQLARERERESCEMPMKRAKHD